MEREYAGTPARVCETYRYNALVKDADQTCANGSKCFDLSHKCLEMWHQGEGCWVAACQRYIRPKGNGRVF